MSGPPAINWIILIVAVLAVPYSHGPIQYVGLILAAILLVALNMAIAQQRVKRVVDSK